MSRLDVHLEKAVHYDVDDSSIIDNFNKLYSDTVHPPIEELQTFLLVAAVEAKRTSLVSKLLISDYPVNYKFGFASPSPLHAAVYAGCVDLVQLLLRHGASVNLISRATLHQSDEACIFPRCLYYLYDTEVCYSENIQRTNVVKKVTEF